MPLYESYATKANLAEYLFIPVNQLPTDSERLLSRASELVKHATVGNIDIYNENHLEAAKKAVCAQVEYWLNIGEDKAIVGNIKNYSIGDLSVTYDELISNKGALCDRARMFLNDYGLLYRGI